MIEDCKAGRIGVIITKSISRFARNTLDTFELCKNPKGSHPAIIEKEMWETVQLEMERRKTFRKYEENCL